MAGPVSSSFVGPTGGQITMDSLSSLGSGIGAGIRNAQFQQQAAEQKRLEERKFATEELARRVKESGASSLSSFLVDPNNYEAAMQLAPKLFGEKNGKAQADAYILSLAKATLPPDQQRLWLDRMYTHGFRAPGMPQAEETAQSATNVDYSVSRCHSTGGAPQTRPAPVPTTLAEPTPAIQTAPSTTAAPATDSQWRQSFPTKVEIDPETGEQRTAINPSIAIDPADRMVQNTLSWLDRFETSLNTPNRVSAEQRTLLIQESRDLRNKTNETKQRLAEAQKAGNTAEVGRMVAGLAQLGAKTSALKEKVSKIPGIPELMAREDNIANFNPLQRGAPQAATAEAPSTAVPVTVSPQPATPPASASPTPATVPQAAPSLPANSSSSVAQPSAGRDLGMDTSVDPGAERANGPAKSTNITPPVSPQERRARAEQVQSLGDEAVKEARKVVRGEWTQRGDDYGFRPETRAWVETYDRLLDPDSPFRDDPKFTHLFANKEQIGIAKAIADTELSRAQAAKALADAGLAAQRNRTLLENLQLAQAKAKTEAFKVDISGVQRNERQSSIHD
ncbi:MAG: hypothetical protein HC888_02685 [Candidatus Competibacteraceae bacterium]|nr:hypothetical protein [Candidatus Competibacteraceae bacterium]